MVAVIVVTEGGVGVVSCDPLVRFILCLILRATLLPLCARLPLLAFDVTTRDYRPIRPNLSRGTYIFSTSLAM